MLDYITDKIMQFRYWIGLYPMYAYYISDCEYKKPKRTIIKKFSRKEKRRFRNYLIFISEDSNLPRWDIGSVLFINPSFDRLRRNDYVVLENDKGEIKLGKIKCPGWPGLPDIYYNGELPGINCWIVGKLEFAL